MTEWDGRHGELDADTPDDPATRIPLQLTVTREIRDIGYGKYSGTRIMGWHEASGGRLWTD